MYSFSEINNCFMPSNGKIGSHMVYLLISHLTPTHKLFCIYFSFKRNHWRFLSDGRARQLTAMSTGKDSSLVRENILD